MAANKSTYITLDDPLAPSGTVASGINDSGQIVGYYGFSVMVRRKP
jgi:hypothetical protein